MLNPLPQTARLQMREFTQDDLGRLIAIAAIRDDFTFYSLKPNRDTPLAEIRDRAQAIIDYARATREEGERTGMREHFKLAVWRKGEQHKPATMIGYVAMDDVGDDAKRDIGYFIDPDHQGQGYATEAARGVLDHFFAASNHDRINLTVHPDNHASRHVAEHLGFVQTGVSTMRVNGHVEPRNVMILHRENYLAKGRQP